MGKESVFKWVSGGMPNTGICIVTAGADTASDDAERLYARLGCQRVRVVPGYALLPNGEPCDTTYFYKVLGG